MNKFILLGISWIFTTFFPLVVFNANAQNSTFTLNEAISYGISNNLTIQNSKIDQSSADARIGELRAIGLPQINASLNYNNNAIVPRFFVPANQFDPTAAEGEVVALKFGVTHSPSAMVSLSQLVFDASYLIGLKAAETYKELSVKSTKMSEIQVAEAITKAYYNVMINEERLALLRVNVSRLDSMFEETKHLNKEGFVEQLDVDRLEVQRNNLMTEMHNVERLQDLALSLLKFQMTYPQNEPIQLEDKLSDVNIKEISLIRTGEFTDYEQRIEFSTLKVQEELQKMDIRNITAGYYPSLSLNANYGYATGTDYFKMLFHQPWFNQATIGVTLSVPIWDSFSKKHKIIQSRNELSKILNNQQLLQQSINLEISQSEIQLENLSRQLAERQRNLNLADEVIRVTKIKYQEGVGSNIEVINAETSFKEAQTNYFATLYDLLIARVDLLKSRGELYK